MALPDREYLASLIHSLNVVALAKLTGLVFERFVVRGVLRNRWLGVLVFVTQAAFTRLQRLGQRAFTQRLLTQASLTAQGLLAVTHCIGTRSSQVLQARSAAFRWNAETTADFAILLVGQEFLSARTLRTFSFILDDIVEDAKHAESCLVILESGHGRLISFIGER